MVRDSAGQQTPDSQPYVNSLQEWIGESEKAGKLLVGWHIASALLVVVGGILMGWVLVGIAGGVSLFVSTHVHFWRNELAPEVRHPRREY